jgi:hypothetical protein
MKYRTDDGENLLDIFWKTMCIEKLYLRNKFLLRTQYVFSWSQDFIYLHTHSTVQMQL